MFQIESNIPVPVGAGVSRGNAVYPFSMLEIGQSFFVPDMNARALANASQHHSKKLGRKFTCRTVDGGVRCWRIA